MDNTLPGTLWLNRGRWNWRVKLPGDDRRKNFPLRLPGQQDAIPEAKGRDLAVSLAWRLWERATASRGATAHDKCMTLDDVASRFLAWAATAYRRPDGTQTREADNCTLALRELRARLGAESINNVSYEAILEARDALEASGLNRTTVNQRVGIWKRMIAWALEQRLCSAATKSDWWAIGNLRRGRTAAPEPEPVRPVTHLAVKRTLPFLSTQLQAMVQVHELTGMRPGELCSMRPCDIERRGRVWVYRPAQHKTSHKDQVRVVVIGPRAQRVLSQWVKAGCKSTVFDPPGSEGWPVRNYSRAVQIAVIAAQKAGVEVDHWHPNQLRHACGTRVRRKCGADAARAVLGHSSGVLKITDRYTRSAIEAELIAAASRPMLRLG